MQNKRSKLSEQLTSLFYSGIQSNLASFLNHQDLAELSLTNKASHIKLKSFLEIRKILLWCIRGDIKPLIAYVSEHPEALFIKGDIEDESTQQSFYQVSAFQLILFLGDWDLLKQVTPLLQEQHLNLANLQSLQLKQGGPDLVKIDFNPMSCEFSQLLQTQEHHLSFPLLQNPDGILVFEDRLYYVNQKDQIINPLPAIEAPGYLELVSKLNQMYPNSSCRSSDLEHHWIKTHYNINLHRDGILFVKDGQSYRDIKVGCQLLHCYRQYLDLADQQQSVSDLEQYWINGVGKAQRDLPVHLMQRLCANDKFSPLRSVESYRIQRFIRRDMYDNQTLNRYHDVYPLLELGRSFALSKGTNNKALSQVHPTIETVLIDLNAFHRFFKLSSSFNCKWQESLSLALTCQDKAENPFFPLLTSVNALQTQPRVVNLAAFLPEIIILKLTDYLHKKSGQLAIPFFQALLQKIINEENYFISQVWPIIRRDVYRYTEMELGRYMTLEIDELVQGFKIKSVDLKLFKP